MTDDGEGTRQERRADKLRRKKARIKKSGKGLSKVYLNALRKRKSSQKTDTTE
jgi:hypothetical protein